MLKILLNAYACCPDMGSEQGMAWNFVKNLSALCELHVITESEYERENRQALAEGDRYGLSPEQCARIHFHFVPVGGTEEESARIRRMCWDQGNWAFYPKYARWQEKALRTARQLVEREGIHVMHQLNMAGFREPGLLYRINEERQAAGRLPLPLVWGPSAGYGSIPFPFMTPGGAKFTIFYLIKNLLNDLQLRLHPRVRKMAHAAHHLLAATPEMKTGLEKAHGVRAEHMNETGCLLPEDGQEAHNHRFDDSGRLRICWVGRFLYTKQLPLALRVIARLRDLPGLEFHIVGEGFTPQETRQMHRLAHELDLDEVCRWHGKIPNAEVQTLMQDSHLFFFTSIFEATSTVILEAIQNRLPIVCFDRCGFGPLVDESIGRKIPCRSPRQAEADFEQAIRALNRQREELAGMSEACRRKQEALSWPRKIARLTEIYHHLADSSRHEKGASYTGSES